MKNQRSGFRKLNREKKKQLGMSLSTARARLIRMIIHSLLEELGRA